MVDLLSCPNCGLPTCRREYNRRVTNVEIQLWLKDREQDREREKESVRTFLADLEAANALA
jgi:hypothetical protein